MWIGVGKLIQQGTREITRIECEAVKCMMLGKRNMFVVNMDDYPNCMPRGSKTIKSNPAVCGRGVPCKDEDLKREISLTLSC